MRDLVRKKSFLVRKYIDTFLYKRIPKTWIPLYSTIHFSRMRFRDCIANKQWQDKVGRKNCGENQQSSKNYSKCIVSNNYLFTGFTQNRLLHDILNHSYINGVPRRVIRKEKYFVLNFNTRLLLLLYKVHNQRGYVKCVRMRIDFTNKTNLLTNFMIFFYLRTDS